MKKFFLLVMSLFFAVTQYVTAQEELFINEGETVVYRVALDASVQSGTVSDALQNLPGVRVDMEGNITMRGVSNVEIFINDQPSHFSYDTQKNYIQQTSVMNIKEIRVMVNPSARYTTATDTGIINIILKDEKKANQALNIGVQANTLPNIAPWLSYSYSKNKLSFSADVKATYYKQATNIDSEGISFDENGIDTTNIGRNFEHVDEKNLCLQAAFNMNYKFNEKNNLSFYISGDYDKRKSMTYDSTFRKEFNNETLETSETFETFETFQYITDKDYSSIGFEGNTGFTFQHLFNENGHQISANLNFLLMPGYSDCNSYRKYNIGDIADRTTREQNDYSDLHWDAKVEYNLPYSDKGELYVAFLKTHKPDGNVLLFDTLAGNEWSRDTLRTEIRNYYTDKNELIINVQQHVKRFTFKPGVDFEYTIVQGIFPNEHWYDFNKSFFKVHPSLFITYSTENQHNFSIGYTHKTEYPYVRYFSSRILYQEDSFDAGNPDLKPASTHVLKAEWTKYWEKFGSVGINAYYKGSSDYINQVQYSVYNSIYGRYVTYTQPVNLGGYYNAGGEFNITYRPNAMLNVRFYANLYNSHLEEPKNDDTNPEDVVKSDMFCYNFTINVWTKLWNRLELHAEAYYNSKTQALYSYSQTPYGIDCGLKVDFFKNRLSLLVNVNDLFDWNRSDYTINQPTYKYFSTQKVTSRYVSAELIFKIM